MFKLDDNFLHELGLGSLPVADKKAMLNHIYETLEMRVGMKLAEQMTNEQLDEFEGYINRNDEPGALKWLETNFPNYKQVVADELEKLKVEIKAAAPQILATASQAPAQMPAEQQPPMGYPAQQQPMQPQAVPQPQYQQQATQMPMQPVAPQPGQMPAQYPQPVPAPDPQYYQQPAQQQPMQQQYYQQQPPTQGYAQPQQPAQQQPYDPTQQQAA